MRVALTTSIILSSILFSSISSAHMLMKDEAATMPYNWTGFYVGLNAGIVKHTMNVTDVQATSFYATIQEASNPQFTGGLQAGYRRQLDLTRAASGVYGLEFSANFSGATFNKEYGSPFALYQLSAENELKNVLLLQLMGGITADKALLFLTAGLSGSTINGGMTTENGVPFFNSFNDNETVFGTILGGGVEYAFTKAISMRLKVDVITPNTFLTYDNANDSFQISNNIVQGTVGVNYKFA